MAAPAPAPKQGKTDGYPCPECGAPTSYKPGTEDLACDHCGKGTPIIGPAAQLVTYDLYGKAAIEAVEASRITSGGREVVCKTCGARSISTRQAQRCAFCDSPMIVEVEADAKTIPPGGLLPFEIEKKAAGDQFARWLKTRWFAPSDLLKRAERDGMDGVYLPYWTYDAETRTPYEGERGDHYYVSETYTENGETKTRQVQHTRWSDRNGTVNLSFNDVLVCGSPTLPEKLLEKLEPWDLPSVRGFDGKFLAGFQAERYQINQSDGFLRAGERMDPKIKRAIRSEIGGDEQRINSMQVNYDVVGFRHLLLPLWLTAFRYNDRVFHVTVNARTGEIAGERPWSAMKIVLLVVVIAAAITATVLALTHR